tara:strand:- start:1323 stop:2342 length:1020 start_codon:yes stop_codon:yes gene_type:complete
MAVTSTIEYCNDRDVQDVFPNLSGFDLKRRIINWETSSTTNLYLVRNSGLVTQLFANGKDLGNAESGSASVNADEEWYYDSDLDTVYYFDPGTNPNDMIMEAGDDWTTIKTRFRRKASRFVESMLDSRISREMPRNREGDYPEVIVRMTALKTVIFLLQAHDPNNDFIDPFQEEFNELLDGIRNGHIVLDTQVSGDSSKGVIRRVSVNASSTLYPIQLRGHYLGTGYDLLKVYIDSGEGGAIGTARMTVKGKSDTSLKSDIIVDSEIITGDFQSIDGGLEIRWSAAVIDGSTDVATAGDEYEIELYSAAMDATISNVGSVNLTRGGYGHRRHTRKIRRL